MARSSPVHLLVDTDSTGRSLRTRTGQRDGGVMTSMVTSRRGDEMKTHAAVGVRGMIKEYAGRRAVDGLDLEIRAGEVFALLGPNGAGKTTTVEILEGYRKRDSGEVSVLGVDPEPASG